MQSVFEFLFKYRPEVFSKGDFVFGAPSSVMLLLALGLLIGGPAGMSDTRGRGERARPERLVLGGLRGGSLVVSLLWLFRPAVFASAPSSHRHLVSAPRRAS